MRNWTERFKVQKGTVRAALERLKEEGIVYSVKGVGTFAAEKKILRHMERFESFSQMAQENGSTVTTKLLSCRVIPAGNALTEEFGLTPRSDITETVRLRSHLHQLDAMLRETQPVGRKLDSLCRR